MEADPELSGLTRIEVDSVGQGVDTASGSHSGCAGQSCLGRCNLGGLDFEALGKVGLIRQLAGVTRAVSVVGCNDLVIHIELSCADETTVGFDALLDTQIRDLRSFVFVDEGTGDGSSRIALRTANVLEVDAASGLGDGDVFTDAIDTLDVFELPLRVSNLIFRNGEVGVANFEGNEV